jgi:ATP-dependent DNA helicase RecG
MDESVLLRLLREGESYRAECKETLKGDAPDRIREAICAFANDLPGQGETGVVFVGVRDDGSCAGLRVTDELLRQLSDMRSDGNILPPPTLTVRKLVLEGREIAVVCVEPSLAPPVRFGGRVHVRVGPRRGVATAEEELRLAERGRTLHSSFDARPVEAATLADLDLDLFERTYLPCAVSPDALAANTRSREHQLTSLGFATGKPDQRPTVAGIIVFGTDPCAFVSGAAVQFVRLAGADLDTPIQDEKRIAGPLPDVLRRLDEVFEAHIRVAVDATAGALEVRRPDYPMVAIQQLARNAVLHRTYEWSNAPVRLYWFDDRIEIHSPGGPFGQVDRANFGRPGVTDYRNPRLAEAMRNLGYVQRFGVGIPMAQRALADNGNPPAEFAVEDALVAVTLRRAS